MSSEFKSLDGKNRESTQSLLQRIYASLEAGETEFEISASGQHDIGGPLWSEDGSKLTFRVTNPGQRVGAFGLEGTEIIIEGSAPADVGWLNAGATLILKGSAGDTAAHCAAAGCIYVGGRVGTRSGSLMKHDPAFDAPQFWVLKNTGSFSFEFMGGGTAVICGYDCEHLKSVLGDRSCMGMVGGTIYIRGAVEGLPNDIWQLDLDEGDRDFLTSGMSTFLEKIEQPELFETLTDFSQWKKIVAKSYEERNIKSRVPMLDFMQNKWVEGGIFGDVVKDNYSHVAGLVNVGDDRLKVPHWMNKYYSAPCEYACPSSIPTQDRLNLLRQGKVKEALELVLHYTPFPGSVCGQVCPNPCMDACSRRFLDNPVSMKELGNLSRELKAPEMGADTGKKIAVIGGGPGGLSAAWQLKLAGHQVCVYEADSKIGGKLTQVIPDDRLPSEVLNSELERIRSLGIEIQTGREVDTELFNQIRDNSDAVVIATGAHNPIVIPFPGHERMIRGLDFLKAVNDGEKPEVGEKVVVLGAGNAGIDVVIGAYAMGAKKVTAIDIQKPAAFAKELDHVHALGAEVRWPVFTDRVSEKGVHTKDGELIEADTVIISIGERPDLSYIPREWLTERGMMEVDDCWQVAKAPGVFAIGDTTNPGLLTHAIGHGHEAADYIQDYLEGKELVARKKPLPITQNALSRELFQPQRRSSSCSTGDCESGRCISCGTCRDCSFCLEGCPELAITREERPNGKFEYISDPDRCIGCGICAGVCPCGIWAMEQVV